MLALWAGAALEERLMGVGRSHSLAAVVLARISRAVLIVVAVLLSLSLVGLDLTVLSVFGGALGVGLGLGMQRIASNYVSGFIILLERSLSIGDMITVDKYYRQGHADQHALHGAARARRRRDGAAERDADFGRGAEPVVYRRAAVATR